MCFENLFNIYKKVLYKEMEKFSYKYAPSEIGYILNIYEDFEKDIHSLINHLVVESKRCRDGGNYDIYNSEQLFISLYNKFKNIN